MSHRNYWALMREGDKAAFDRLYDFYFDSLFGLGRQYISDEDIVRDCIQDLFAHLWLNREKLPDVISVKAYLFRSLKNRLFNILKREKIFREKTSRDLKFQEESSVSSPHEAFMISSEEDSAKKVGLRRALGELTDHQREALFLRYYENMGYDEIADTLSLRDVKYARTLIYRSLETLKNGLKKASIFGSIDMVIITVLSWGSLQSI